MSKRSLSILVIFIGTISILLFFNVTALPNYTEPHDTCHTVPGGYIITTNINTTNSVDPSTTIIFNITASGSSLFVQAPLDAKNNIAFNVSPTTNRIIDGSAEDKDPNPNAMIVTFNIKIPEIDGFYYFFVLAGDNSVSSPNPPTFAYLEIEFSVGGVAPPVPEINIFDHFEVYLGLPALILLTLGTILVLVNENKFVKIHGIFAGSSWILTLVNVLTLFSKDPNIFFAFTFGIHWIHIILGFVGLISGFFSMLFGIAAERKYAKISGYITLISWWAALFLGFILVPIF